MIHCKSCLSACCILLCVGCASVGQQSSPSAVTLHESAQSDDASQTVATKIQTPQVTATVKPSDGVAMVGYEPELDGYRTRDANDFSLEGAHFDATEVHQESFSDLVATNGSYAFDWNPSVGESFKGEEVRYTLEQIEQLALGNNPTLLAASATASKASGLRTQVGTRPNPTLGYFGQQLADRDTDQHGVFVEQEFVRGNKLTLNREVLGHTTSAQRWEIQVQRYRVLTDIRVRFFEAVAAQRRADATRAFETVARRGVQVAQDRQNAEEGNLVEVLQAKTLLSEILLAAEQAEVEYRGAWQDLAAIAGISQSAPVRLDDQTQLPTSSPNWNTLYDEILSQSPERSAAEALVCEKYALLKRQRVQMVPNVTAQFGAGYDRGTDSGMINLQFGAPVPVWNKNSGNISAAYADYTRALENVKRIEQSIKARLARAAQEFDSSMVAVTKYQSEIIPQTKQSLELSEDAYRAGELEFLQVLVVRRSYYESAIRMISAQARLAQANAALDGLLLTGGLDAPADYTDGDGIRGASFGGQ